MITATLTAIAAWFMKIGLLLSHLKFQVELLTLNVKGILAHYNYTEGFRVGRMVSARLPF
jgi:hypothetical protein